MPVTAAATNAPARAPRRFISGTFADLGSGGPTSGPIAGGGIASLFITNIVMSAGSPERVTVLIFGDEPEGLTPR